MSHRFLAVILCLLSFAASARSVTDLADRNVQVPDKVERILLGEGRFLVALGLLEGADLTKRLVGTMGEFVVLDPDGYAQYRKQFPALEKLPLVGQTSSDSFSVEKAISLKPQVAIFGLEGHGPSPANTEVISKLQAAGIAVVFIDFRKDPLAHTERSMTLLGQVLGREKEALAFTDFYRTELARVTDGLKGVTRKPRVFLESRVGLREECCETMVNGMMGRFLDAAGGENMARALVPGQVGVINLEYLLSQQPDIYVATAIGNSVAGAGSRRILMGAGVSAGAAQQSLASSMKRQGIASLKAVKSGHAHAIWHHFYDSPLNVVAVQAFAKWFHPDRFATLDPSATLTTLYKRFQPLPLDGTYWTTLGVTP
ncbi:MAG TPA: ABC transporter substrate-binding protein [Rhodocyclaceae bacterium]|nr:ABC transporter substrate-binding protein [Rhodocyclaceae bacterium]